MESAILVSVSTGKWVHDLLHQGTFNVVLLLSSVLEDILGITIVIIHGLLVLEVVLILGITTGGELWLNWLMIGYVDILELLSLLSVITGGDIGR